MNPVFVNLNKPTEDPSYINLNCVARIKKYEVGKMNEARITYWGEVGTSRECFSSCTFEEFMSRVQEALEANKC